MTDLEDLLSVAKKLQKQETGIDLWTLLTITRWVDERRDDPPGKRKEEVAYLFRRAIQETNLEGRPTEDALSFAKIGRNDLVDRLIPLIEEAIEQSVEDNLQVRAFQIEIMRGVSWVGAPPLCATRVVPLSGGPSIRLSQFVNRALGRVVVIRDKEGR